MAGDVLQECCTRPVFLGDRKGMGTKIGVFAEARSRGRYFPEDCRAVLGDLDQFGCNQRIQPEEVGKHFFEFVLFHTSI